MSRIRFPLFSSFCLCVCLGFGACTTDKDKKSSAATTTTPKSKTAPDKAAEGEEKPIEVFTQKIEKSEIFDPLFFGGIVLAQTSSPLFSAVNGIVQKVYQQPGSQLNAGQAIVSVRPQDAIGTDFLPHVVRAPISGLLSRLDAQVGELVRNDQHLGDVAQLENYETVIQATYQDLFQFKKHMPVNVLVAVGSPMETMIDGKVVYISEQPEPASGTYSVKVSLQCSKPKNQCRELLRLGSYLKVLLKQNIRQGYSIHKRALHEDNRRVIVMDKDQKAQWLDVKVGQVLGESVEIVSGLEKAAEEGSRLVVSFGRYPKEGSVLTAGSKKDSLMQYEKKPVHAESQNQEKPEKKG